MSEAERIQEAIDIFEAGRKFSMHGTIKINLNEIGYKVVLNALHEARAKEQNEPLTCDGCDNYPSKYGWSGLNAPCRVCVRGISTYDYYRSSGEPKHAPDERSDGK